MVKRRTKEIKAEPSQAQIDAFASQADGEKKEESLNPNAKRNFKSISVPLNEYEYKELEKLAEKTGRSKLNAIRWAFLSMNKEPN